MSIHTTEANFRSVPVRALDADALDALSSEMKLSLSREDMLAVQSYYNEAGREPTDVELEVIAQTWSEHCKHRIFSANIEHKTENGSETVDSLFKTFIMKPSLDLMDRKPGFVLSAFHDNAGFIRLDDDKAVCLKVETHNHPSALEPYAGANTGIGGVVRDILGAGKGAKPIGSLDVFCFGAPDTPQVSIKGDDVIHPLGVMRGVVRGVRDYGNRMGIPTVAGAIQFDPSYVYNPLVFCGTAGVIPTKDIDKEMRPGLKVIAVGGRTGRDGLKGATFSSAALTGDSHAEDQSAVQIGNPIEEKKVGDFILKARDEELIVFLTDCGAGGFSSAAGEMLSETGGELFLENAPLKEPGLFSWEVFLSESQERMVLAVEESSLERLQELADTYETEMTVLGHSDDSGILKVLHHGEMVCELDCLKLHNAPQRQMKSKWVTGETRADHKWPADDFGMSLKTLLNGFTICSRSPIIREYDHEVQGNTLLKPLAGAKGDAPQDGSVIEIDGSEQALSMGLSILPEWGKFDPYRMGLACVDECIRSLVLTGSEPDRIAILDNFCVGNPDDETELGALVETVKGIAKAADAFGTPFVSGKDSFYNYFQTPDGTVSIPTTILVSGMGIVEDKANVLGSSIRKDDSVICIMGSGTGAMGGSVYARRQLVEDAEVPDTDLDLAVKLYKAFAKARKGGGILSAHDVSEGGLAVTLAEMTFSEKAGMDVSLTDLPGNQDHVDAVALFNEAPSRIVMEVAADQLEQVTQAFAGLPFAVIGKTTSQHKNLSVTRTVGGEQKVLIDEDIDSLKSLWKNGLTPFY